MRAIAVRYVLASGLVSSAVLGPRKSGQLDQLVRDAGKDRRYLPEGGRAAVHAEIPVGTLCRMHFAYPTFHRVVLGALVDLGL